MKVFIITMMVVLAGLVMGLHLAAKKPLWNDEIYSQTASVEHISWADIMAGKIQEGNNAPLFYLLQKTICAVSGYALPAGVTPIEYFYEEKGQRILRILPSLCMAFGIGVIFFYAASVHGWLAGVLSLGVTLSTYMVWAYWAEARPYALWFFLGTCQSVLLMHILAGKTRASIGLAMVHVLLAFTGALSVLQIAAAFVLWRVFDKMSAKDFWIGIVLPVIIVGFYLAVSPKYKFWFNGSPVKLLCAALPVDRVLFIAACSAWIWVVIRKENIRRGFVFLAQALMLTGLLFAGALALIGYLKIRESGAGQGFEIPNRYFMFLTPAVIMATLLSAVAVLCSGMNVWVRYGFLAVFGVWTLLRVKMYAGF